ncbi:hypothetical protein [Falsochrobactrum shanghaiense]|uniref:hypothetical protein n=1 Tax=Falsochrobactrum shanghaiense TaxID=2201899 RepID=UPI0018EE986B|nr:hypothetical protein [Falsochrobactrum shanghaiense]
MPENKQGGSGQRGGTHEQHVKAGEQSHKNADDKKSADQRGGSHEQHVKAGQQSHKNK